MPFVAVTKSTGNRVNILDYQNPRLDLLSSDLSCPLCGEEMIIVAGAHRISHFRHKVVCSSDFQSHPESPEHLQAKIDIVDLLRNTLGEYTDASIDMEVPIPEVRRIADVLVSFPMGWREAHEIQLSPISVLDLEARTNDYARAGISVTWWLGKRAYTDSNVLWCQDRFGACNTISFAKAGKAVQIFEGAQVSQRGVAV